MRNFAIMDRSRRPGPRSQLASSEVPAASRLVINRPARNRRRGPSVWRRLPGPKVVAIACGRGLRRSAPTLAVLGAVSGVVTLTYLGIRFLTHSPRFGIQTIEVRGVSAHSADEVRALLPVDLGDNVFTADVRRAEATLRAVSWVAAAEVRRELPSTLVVEVRERHAVALLDLGELYLADASGHPFQRADRTAAATLPVITGWERADYAADRAAVASSAVEALAAIAAWSAPAGSSARPAVYGVDVDAGRGLTLLTTTGLAVQLGAPSPEQLPARLARFDLAWASLGADERTRAHTIHLDRSTRSEQVIVAFAKD
jgi:cell division septal protein FtsQ